VHIGSARMVLAIRIKPPHAGIALGGERWLWWMAVKIGADDCVCWWHSLLHQNGVAHIGCGFSRPAYTEGRGTATG